MLNWDGVTLIQVNIIIIIIIKKINFPKKYPVILNRDVFTNGIGNSHQNHWGRDFVGHL